MIHNILLSKLSCRHLDRLKNKYLNCIYTDTLAREQVLQQNVEPDRAYTISSNYKLWILPCSPLDTLDGLKLEEQNPLFASSFPVVLKNDDLCQITGINYYGLVEQYQKNICVIDIDEFYK